MEAKDTVMNPIQITQIYSNWVNRNPNQLYENFPKILLAEAQAEISFKTGEDKGYAHARQHCEDVIIPQAERQARREVMEFMQTTSMDAHTTIFQVSTSKLVTKLKEWGIERG